MSFFEGIEEYMEAMTECTGPDSFREQETWLRARIKVLEKRLREANELVADMECQCLYPGDICQRCEVVSILIKEPTYDGRVA